MISLSLRVDVIASETKQSVRIEGRLLNTTAPVKRIGLTKLRFTPFAMTRLNKKSLPEHSERDFLYLNQILTYSTQENKHLLPILLRYEAIDCISPYGLNEKPNQF
jgi:hypothetical protein